MLNTSLKGKTALITGGSRGIGLAIATAFSEQGVDLFLTARDPSRLEEAAASLQSSQARVVHCTSDMMDADSISAMFETAVGRLGHIDILVNNAGIHIGKPFTDYSMEDFDRVMRTNVYSVFQLMQLALKHMQGRGHGKIINIASTAGKWESPGQAVYNTSKHAVVGMTRCAALENAHRGINVNAICPGMVETDMFRQNEPIMKAAGLTLDDLKTRAIARIPMGRFLQAEEISPIAVYLASDVSNGMTGQTITISGGMRMG